MDDVVASQDVEVQESVTLAGEQARDAEQRLGEVPVVDRALVAQLVAGARAQGLDLAGENGLLGQLTKLVLESALEGESTDHLGYEPHERGGSGDGNSRNGTRSKTTISTITITITVEALEGMGEWQNRPEGPGVSGGLRGLHPREGPRRVPRQPGRSTSPWP